MWLIYSIFGNTNLSFNDLEDDNLWKPRNPRVKVNPKYSSETEPGAYEYNGNWYYNFVWAIEEAKYLWKRIPTKDEWTQISKNENNNTKRASLLLWHHWTYSTEYTKYGQYYRKFYAGTEFILENFGEFGYYWSSSVTSLLSSSGTNIPYYSCHSNHYIDVSIAEPNWGIWKWSYLSVKCFRD